MQKIKPKPFKRNFCKNWLCEILRIGLTDIHIKKEKMINPNIDTDNRLMTIKKAFYDFRDIDFDAMTEKEREDFRKI